MSTKRLTKGYRLTFRELDSNFEEIDSIFLQKANTDLSNVTQLSDNVRNALKGEKGDVGDINPENITNAESAARSASRAEISKINADNAATRSETSATNAANSRSQAGTSATNSANSATQAATSASNASLSANTATTKASEASSSAFSSATSATNSANSAASALAIYGSINAINTAVNNASTSATNSANSATNASTSATNSANSATASANSAAEASNSANNTSALLASFRSIFLGSFATDSEAASFANSNSIALTDGVMYENTTGTPNKFRIYNGVSWDDYDSSAQASQSSAALSAANSASSASASETSAINSANSATASAVSATNAATSATNSANSATESANSADTSDIKAAEASISATNAATSAANSANSATTATDQAAIATTKAENANTSADTATTQATNAAVSASSASNFATNAANSASEASTSATDAANSATAASVSATGASTSASISGANASNAASSATSASESAATATTQAANASTSAINASNSESAVLASKNAAATSESNAANSSTTATTQAEIATAKASEATTSESNAASSASSALSAKVAAESARDQALTAFDNFDDRYLGQKSSDPTLDNDGNALLVGALYFNTVSPGAMKVYDGTSWLNAYSSLSGALLSANNLSDVESASTARTNIGAYAASNPSNYTTLAAVAGVGYATGGGTASGSNTGDETTATIKSKLSITTLSGSNTGDETTATIKSKLSITTLSGSNTGDQVIPTSLPASDVYAWAKASVKPSYSKSEVGLGNVDNTADANKSVNYANTAGSAPANGGTSSNTNSISNALGNAYAWTGIQHFLFNSGNTGNTSNPPLQAFSNNGNGAIMAFHRGGQYAVNFGLDSDNVMRIGGWSAAANRWELDMSGNNWAASSFRAPIFYDNNDTGYYCNPNETSRFAALNINTGNWLSSSEGHNRILFDSSGSTHLRGIWGDSWWLRFGWQSNDTGVIFEGGGNIYAQGNITAYWSDRRLKTNIKKIDNWRTIIDGINGYYYEWNENGKRVLVGDDPKDQGTMVGFIAQEVNAVLPQAAAVQELQFKNGKHEPRDDIADIVDLDDPFLTVKEEKLMPVLTEAIKYLLAEVDSLKLQIKQLEKNA